MDASVRRHARPAAVRAPGRDGACPQSTRGTPRPTPHRSRAHSIPTSHTPALNGATAAPRDNSEMTARWDLFCRVIDNFGDAGIAWRLARELHDEHGLAVTIWIDAPDVLLPLTGALAIDDPPLVHGIHVLPL